jgi:hypothetical protein
MKNRVQLLSLLAFHFFFGVPHLATFIFDVSFTVKDTIPYIHPEYGAGVQTQDLLVMSRLPYPLDQGSQTQTGLRVALW